MGIECFRVQFPKGQDANEYALKTQPAAKSVGRVAARRGMAGHGQAARGVKPVRSSARCQCPERSREPEPMKSEEQSAATAEEQIKPAAKEENAIVPPLEPVVESVLSLAAAL